MLFWSGSEYVIDEKWYLRLSKTQIQLPLAHTCTFTLELPNIKTKEKLKQALDIALKFGTIGYDESIFS